MQFGFTKSSLGLTDEDIKKAESGNGGPSKFMGVGVHTVKITEASYNGGKSGKIECDSDPTWVKLSVNLENAAGQSKKTTVIVPTSKLTFTTARGKETAFMFVKFKQFCAGIGESISADPIALGSLMKRLFADPKKLIGKKLEITIAYQAAYLDYVGKDGDNAQYSLMSKDGEILEAGPFTKQEAQLAAARRKVQLADFPEIVNITSKIVEKKVEEPQEEVAAPADEPW
jgi:hypothetical protein